MNRYFTTAASTAILAGLLITAIHLGGAVKQSYAQDMPGPASGGWWVLIGKPQRPNMVGEPRSGSEALIRGQYMTAECFATIVPTADNKRAWFHWGLLDVYLTRDRVGPYHTVRDAVRALSAAGWTDRSPLGWTASSGC